MTRVRPSVFIGSSREGLPVAEAIQLNLDTACEVTIWSQGIFGLTEGTLEALVDRLDSFDFGILVLTADDMTLSREQVRQSPRDNVLLELGLCVGALGRKRTFIVYDRSQDMRLPSDLAGVTPATFEPHSNGNLQAALGATTTLIKGTIQQLDRRQKRISAEIDASTQFQIIHDLLQNAPEQFIIWMHENNQSLLRQPRLYDPGIPYVFELRNQAGGQGYFSMDELCSRLPDAGLLEADLRNNVSLTARGHQFAQWLIENGHKATYFQSNVGTWGVQPTDNKFTWFLNRPGAQPMQKPTAADEGNKKDS